MKPVVRNWLIPVGILVVAVAIAFMLISGKKPPEKIVVPEKAFLVETEIAKAQDLNFIVHSQGTVQPKTETQLSAQVSGKIEKVADVFIEGGMFKKGDVLVQLEQYDYATELKLAEAELARAQASLEEEIARGRVAEQEWRSVKGTVPPELGLRKPQLATEKSNLRAAEAKLERAQRNLDRTTIKAPYDGLVKSRDVDLGQFVTAGTKVGTLYATDVAEIRMPLSDNDLAYLDIAANQQQQPKVTLTANVAGKVTTWQGVLARNEGVLDEQSRVIYAIAEIQDPYLRESSKQGLPLKFGRFVQARIVGSSAQDIIVLPRSVLRLDGSILTVDSKRTLRINEVDVQRADEKYVYIRSGLRSGDLVVTSAVPHPFDGMKVRLPGEKGDKSDLDKEDPVDTAIASSGDAE